MVDTFSLESLGKLLAARPPIDRMAVLCDHDGESCAPASGADN